MSRPVARRAGEPHQSRSGRRDTGGLRSQHPATQPPRVEGTRAVRRRVPVPRSPRRMADRQGRPGPLDREGQCRPARLGAPGRVPAAEVPFRTTSADAQIVAVRQGPGHDDAALFRRRPPTRCWPGRRAPGLRMHGTLWLLTQGETRKTKRVRLFTEFISERLATYVPLLAGQDLPSRLRRRSVCEGRKVGGASAHNRCRESSESRSAPVDPTFGKPKGRLTSARGQAAVSAAVTATVRRRRTPLAADRVRRSTCSRAIQWPEDMTPSRSPIHFTNEREVEGVTRDDLVSAHRSSRLGPASTRESNTCSCSTGKRRSASGTRFETNLAGQDVSATVQEFEPMDAHRLGWRARRRRQRFPGLPRLDHHADVANGTHLWTEETMQGPLWIELAKPAPDIFWRTHEKLLEDLARVAVELEDA